MIKKAFNRRSFLRGTLQGIPVAVGLPLLDIFLNDNATALAAGAPMPVRFGTWFWGLGMNQDRFIPIKVGAEYDCPPELKYIEPFKDDISVLSGFNTFLDGAQNFCHYSGQHAILCGVAPRGQGKLDGPTFDTAISEHIGGDSRFRSLEVASTANPRDSHSRSNPSIINPSEVSPLGLYQRLFGSGFQDPNKAGFTPDPSLMLRQSVLSSVRDQYRDLEKNLGANDRDRMDLYFTSLRQTEQRLELMQQKPAPAEACSIPQAPDEVEMATDVDTVAKTHRLLAELLGMALACNQTRVFNMMYSTSFSTLKKLGEADSHHAITHEEPIDPNLGYQPRATYFVEKSMEAWADFISVLKSIPEGDGSLLDNCAVLAYSDTQFAKIHSLSNIPMMIAGKAGGRLRSGIHVAGSGDPVSRVGLTIQQVMGLDIATYGANSMATDKTITEILA